MEIDVQTPVTPPARERAFNAPVAAIMIVAALLGLFTLQSQWIGVDVWNERFGLTAANLTNGRGWTLVSHLGSHASWAHAGMNAVGVLAFGAPLARRLGDGARGVTAYLAFFLICGVLAGLGFLVIHPASQAILVGASGAVFALIGAATRLMNREHRLEPLLSRRVLTMTAVWVGTNLLVAFVGADPATGTRGVAWEAHLIGLALGLLLVGPWLSVFGAARPVAAQAGPPPARLSEPSKPGPWGSA